MNPQILFNSAIAFFTAGFIFFLNHLITLGGISLLLSIVILITWFLSGLLDKFESSPPEIESEDDKDEEGKGVLKPF